MRIPATSRHHLGAAARTLGEVGEIGALVETLPDVGHLALHLGWALRNSSGVSEGIHKSVVQSDREFLRVGVAGRQ